MALAAITVQELAALGDGVRLVDVREPAEWHDHHVPYAVHVPLATIPERLAEFDGDPTYVMCKVGGRSARACEFAEAHGKNVVNVTGGTIAWAAAGYDLEGESGSDATGGAFFFSGTPS